MLSFAYSRSAGILLSFWSGSNNSDDDYERLLGAWARADDEGLRRFDGVVHVVVVSAENPLPDARQRRRLADFQSRLRAQQTYIALVTKSPVVRGVITAIQWISRPANVETDAYGTLDAAVRWLEHRRGGDMSVVPTLLREAQLQAQVAPAMIGRARAG